MGKQFIFPKVGTKVPAVGVKKLRTDEQIQIEMILFLLIFFSRSNVQKVDWVRLERLWPRILTEVGALGINVKNFDKVGSQIFDEAWDSLSEVGYFEYFSGEKEAYLVMTPRIMDMITAESDQSILRPIMAIAPRILMLYQNTHHDLKLIS